MARYPGLLPLDKAGRAGKPWVMRLPISVTPDWIRPIGIPNLACFRGSRGRDSGGCYGRDVTRGAWVAAVGLGRWRVCGGRVRLVAGRVRRPVVGGRIRSRGDACVVRGDNGAVGHGCRSALAVATRLSGDRPDRRRGSDRVLSAAEFVEGLGASGFAADNGTARSEALARVHRVGAALSQPGLCSRLLGCLRCSRPSW